MTAVASPQSPTSQMLKATAPAWTPVPGLGPALEAKGARKGRSRRKSGRESLEHRMGAAPRGPGLARSGGAAPGARKPASPRSGRRPRHKPQPQQLKVHAPGCACARLVRARAKHDEAGRASGYLVVSRDARAPDLHFGVDADDFAAEPEASESAPSPTPSPPPEGAPRPAARRAGVGRGPRTGASEAKLREAIASASDAAGTKVSCAACLLDGDWRNGAVVVAGRQSSVSRVCGANGALFPAGGDPKAFHGTALPRCVPVNVGGLLRAVMRGEEPIPLPAELALPSPELGEGVVDVKHHIQEALGIVPFADLLAGGDGDDARADSMRRLAALDDECVLVLAYVDARNVVSLDLPGGKRKLAETAWEAAVREMADECKLAAAPGDDRAPAARSTPAARPSRRSYVDGQSVRFFVLRPADHDPAEKAEP
ncbi:hypothetical protein JL720_5040 [Aureococcus anophagefferens]|nr:hypothetical protein JL720_5040 [Aureococcus anophagefferens]